MTACRENKKTNLSKNMCNNMERSFYVTHCLSLNSQLKPDKLYNLMNNQPSEPDEEQIYYSQLYDQLHMA